MDDIDGRHTQTILSAADKINESYIGSNKEQDKQRHCVSLPLYYDQSELCTLGSRSGMECMPLRSPPGPYLYHVNDQTKSLQELQNEVGALLEFRDLVIETFPDLKNKMASISASSTITGVPSSSLASRREWEPGIRVRRKLTQKETADITSSSLIRSRSNSHSGKKEPKSGEGNNGSVVQDSGFSTETSSSKETHSASSTNGTVPTSSAGAVGVAHTINSGIMHRTSSNESEDELWNLLDVIHRKSTRLRDDMEHLQQLEREKCRNSNKNSNLSDMFQLELNRLNNEDMQILRKERDRLLDKLAEMEAETISGRIKTHQMEDEVNALNLVKRDLEEQLRAALSQKLELSTRLHDLLAERNEVIPMSGTESTKSRQRASTATRKFSSPDSTYQQNALSNQICRTVTNNIFSPVIVKSSQQQQQQQPPIDTLDNNNMLATIDAKQLKNDFNLGRLDGLVSSPNRCNKVRVADSKKIAAILLETNIIELQRHLLTITVQNQALTQRLEQATKSKIYLIKKLDKSKEEIDDLRFQLEERNIELEGTKAQLRVLLSKPSKSDYSPEMLSQCDSPVIQNQVSTPSMKAMVPLAMDELQNHSSSTESAHDHAERDNNNRAGQDTSKRRPSKIPLPGSKGYLAPKPPTGRNFVNSKNPSGPPSNKSLSKSTSSLIGRSGPSSIQKLTNPTSPSLHRPDSAHSLRKDTSLGNTSRSSSSIPISTPKLSPSRTNNSPIPKAKRESFTSKVRHMDSLSRMHISPSHSSSSTMAYGSPSPTATTPTHASNNSLYKSNSRKDLSSSFSIGQTRDRKQSSSNVSVRRVSSTSVGSKGIDLSSSTEPVEKICSTNSNDRTQNQFFTTNRDLIREYLARTCAPPAIFRPTTPFSAYQNHMLPHRQLVDIAYKHPLLLIEDNDNDDGETDDIKIVEATTTYENETKTEENNCPCKLVGNVNPNLIKTWEQLNGFRSEQSDNHMYVEELVDTTTNNKSFIIKKKTSGHFYDSIDNESLMTQEEEDQMISSICEEMAAGGEAMAEYLSLIDKKEKICWSIDSCNQ